MPTRQRVLGASTLALAFAGALAACAPSDPETANKETAPITAPSAPEPAAPDEFAYAAILECEGGGELAVKFDYGDTPTARVRTPGGAPITLTLEQSPDAQVYRNGNQSLTLQGGDALYASGGGAPTPCRAVSRAVPPPKVEGVVKDVQEADAGTEVTLTVGQRMSVSLSGVPTAGYLWAPQDPPAFLEKVAETGGPTSTAQFFPGFAGGNHWEVTVFEAKAPGSAELVMVQRRPWEETTEPDAPTFKVKVTVQ